MNVTRNNAPDNKKLHHDVQAQLVNVRGFCGEIERAASELEKLAKCDMRADAESARDVGKLVSDDLLPCIRFLALSTGKLDELVAELRTCTLTMESRR